MAATAFLVAGIAACSLTTNLSGLSGDSDDANDSRDAGDTSDGTTLDASPPADAAQTDAPVPITGWGFRKALTIPRAKVQGDSPLTDFPLLLGLTDADLRPVANGGKLKNGRDLAFFAADGVTALAFEIESLSPATGQLIAWVKVPALSPLTDTKLFLVFGNANVTTSLEDRAAVWSNDFAAVWHLTDAAWTDATNGAPGIAVGGPSVAASGKIGAAATFGANDSYIDVGKDAKLRPTSITVSLWANPASVGSLPDRHPYMLHQDSWRAAGSNPRGYYIEIYRTQTDPRPTFYTANGDTMAHALATTDVINGTWYHVVGTRDEQSGVTRIYVNGALEGSASMTGGIVYDTNIVHLGGIGSESWHGLLDEVRVAKSARSPAWIRTEYENQNAPSSFTVVGALESLP